MSLETLVISVQLTVTNYYAIDFSMQTNKVKVIIIHNIVASKETRANTNP